MGIFCPHHFFYREDDETMCVFRPPLDAAQLPDDIAVVSRAELQEVARLGPNVDMVVKPRSKRPQEKVSLEG